MKFYAALLLLATPAAHAWGATGHRLTGALAQKFLAPQTAFRLRTLLPQNWNASLARTSTWADEIKGGKIAKNYTWASELHYISAQSTPPKSCSFDYERDCTGGRCVVSAIANFTRQLSCDHTVDERSEAIKFIVHFIGDISQPLHVCERQRGGNDASVLFDGRKRNLHSIWDTQIVEKRILKDFGNSTTAYLTHLTNQVYTTYQNQAIKWTQCLNKKRDAPGSGLECAIQWAQDSETLNCDFVWKYYEEQPTADMGKAYYERTWNTVERQIIKAGLRIAAWLDHTVRDCGRTQQAIERVLIE